MSEKHTPTPMTEQDRAYYGDLIKRLTPEQIAVVLEDRERLEKVCEVLLEALKQISLYARVNHDKPRDYGEVADKAIARAEKVRS